MANSPAKADGHNGHHDNGSLYDGAKDKWHDYNKDDNKNKNGSSASTDDEATSLPVSNNISFLIIVAAAIGCKIITDKIKSAKQ